MSALLLTHDSRYHYGKAVDFHFGKCFRLRSTGNRLARLHGAGGRPQGPGYLRPSFGLLACPKLAATQASSGTHLEGNVNVLSSKICYGSYQEGWIFVRVIKKARLLLVILSIKYSVAKKR